MLMKPDSKKSVSLIMDRMMGKPEEVPMVDGAEQDDSIALDTAAEELMAAIESKSPKSIVQAFKTMMELCQSEPEQSEAE